MHRYALAVTLICALAISSILLLRPEPAVELEARLSRMEPGAALAILNADQGDLPSSKNLRLMHARLAAAAADFETADEAYHAVITIGGSTPAVLDEMSEVAAMAGDLGRAAGYKAKAQSLDPDPERREVLGYWYRLLGWEIAETRLLSTTPPERLTTFERARLAELYLAVGDGAAYRDMLMSMSASDGKGAAVARRELLELDLGRGDYASALGLATNWFAEAPDDRIGLGTSLRTLVGRGAVEQASQLAWHVITANPAIGAVPAEVFYASGHRAIARQIQASWLASEQALDAEDWQTLVGVAERTGDLRALHEALARNLPDDEVAPPSAFLQFLRYQGPRALLPFRPFMTPEVFQDEPLVGAAWYTWHRQFAAAYDLLVAASAKSLTDRDRSIWMSIASDLHGTPFYRELLTGAPRDTGLRDMLSLQLRAPVEISR